MTLNDEENDMINNLKETNPILYFIINLFNIKNILDNINDIFSYININKEVAYNNAINNIYSNDVEDTGESNETCEKKIYIIKQGDNNYEDMCLYYKTLFFKVDSNGIIKKISINISETIPDLDVKVYVFKIGGSYIYGEYNMWNKNNIDIDCNIPIESNDEIRICFNSATNDLSNLKVDMIVRNTIYTDNSLDDEYCNDINNYENNLDENIINADDDYIYDYIRNNYSKDKSELFKIDNLDKYIDGKKVLNLKESGKLYYMYGYKTLADAYIIKIKLNSKIIDIINNNISAHIAYYMLKYDKNNNKIIDDTRKSRGEILIFKNFITQYIYVEDNWFVLLDNNKKERFITYFTNKGVDIVYGGLDDYGFYIDKDTLLEKRFDDLIGFQYTIDLNSYDKNILLFYIGDINNVINVSIKGIKY